MADRNITISVGASRKSTQWIQQTLTFSELCERLKNPKRSPETLAEYMAMSKAQQDKLKDVGGFVGGTLSGPRRKADAVTGRDLLTLDYDDLTPEQAVALIAALSSLGIRFCLYSTRKHRPERPRYRIITPTDRTLLPEEYALAARLLAQQIGMAGIDPTTFEAHRLMFWPSVCADGEFIYRCEDGSLLSVQNLFDMGRIVCGVDLKNAATWPLAPGEESALQRQGRKQADPESKPGPVGAFCRTYDIYRAMDELIPGVYTPVDNGSDRYTFSGGSTAGGAVVYDSGKFLFSHHATDPCSGKLVNSFDLVRYHKFGKLDDTAVPGTPAHHLPSYRAMCEYAGNLPEVADLMARERAEDAVKDFAGLVVSVRPEDFSDAGNSVVFVRMYKDNLIFTDSLGWLHWNGQMWERNDHCALAMALRLSDQMLAEAQTGFRTALHARAEAQAKYAATGNEADGKAVEDADAAAKAAKAYLTWAGKSRDANKLRHMTDLAKPALVVKADQLDANPFDLNTLGGIVDLRTGVIRPHEREAYCSRITGATPGEEGADMWAAFLDTITSGDKSLQQFLQEVAGMAVIGSNYHEGIIIAYGGGRNGKLTFFNALGSVLGDYVGHIDSSVLTTDRQNRGAALATLRGKRLVIAPELEEHQRLSASTLKKLASTDTLTVEEKFRQPEDVKQTHTLALFSNFLPRVGSTDSGTWRRLTVVPFTATISEENSIQNYGAVLAEKAGGAILSWAIRGAVKFALSGFKLHIPAAVAAATEEYRQREDWLSNFVSERCIRDPCARVGAAELYQAYREWAMASNEYVRRQSEFTAAMEAAGFQKITPKNKKTWMGLRINLAEIFGNAYAATV